MAKKKKKVKNVVAKVKEQQINLIQKEDKEESIEELLSEEEVSVEEELPIIEESLDDSEEEEYEEEFKEREREKIEEEPRERQRLDEEPKERERQREQIVEDKKDETREREKSSDAVKLDKEAEKTSSEEKDSIDSVEQAKTDKEAEKNTHSKEKDSIDSVEQAKNDKEAEKKNIPSEERKEKDSIDSVEQAKTDKEAEKKNIPSEERKEKDSIDSVEQAKTDKEAEKKNIPSEEKVLEIKNLKTFFYTDEGVVKSVNDVSYYVKKGETLGVVGESGCGKSVTAMSILRLIPQPPGKIVGGEILFKGRDLTKISDEEMRHIRGNRIAMIFQEPMTSLNPVYTVGDQIIEAICLHMDKTYTEARAMALSMLEKVGIPAPANRIDEYPHQMSGGMKQRVMIAMALVCNPELLIADEPTTALDVTIQAQILELLVKLQKDFGTSIIMITHDLGVIAEIAHRVVVMYASKIVETAEVKELFANPKHPYTIGLFNSIPKLDTSDRLIPIKGMVPNPLDFPVGCKFNNRCEFATEKCRKSEPTLKEISPGHWSACWLNDK